MTTTKFVEGDLFAALDRNKKILLPHVCNNVGAFGAGFVVPLGRAFPVVRNEYLAGYSNFSLGDTQFVKVDENLTVCNMIAQTLGGMRPLFYNKLVSCMEEVAQRAVDTDAEIVCPAFGGGLAGGYFKFIEQLIEDCWCKRSIPVTVYYMANALPFDWLPPQIES